MKDPNERYTIAVDFDGVLHSYTTPWIDAHTIPDPPVDGAIEWLHEMLKKFDVVVYTTRARTESGRLAVLAWLAKQGVDHPSLDATSGKPPALVYIDDRAWRFEGTFPTADEIHRARPWNKR